MHSLSRPVTVAKHQICNSFAPSSDPFPTHSAFKRCLSSEPIFACLHPPLIFPSPAVQFGSSQQYSSKWSSEINYVGNVGRHLYIAFDQNSPQYKAECTSAICGSTTGQNNRRPYQPTPKSYTFATILLSAPVINSSYHSLQATLARRFDQHFSIQASFVWSKVTGYGRLDEHLRSQYPAEFDINVPYNFVASYILALLNPSSGIAGKTRC
jgi:hypothetical protein